MRTYSNTCSYEARPVTLGPTPEQQTTQRMAGIAPLLSGIMGQGGGGGMLSGLFGGGGGGGQPIYTGGEGGSQSIF